jgi:hypothetical protein
LDQVIDLLALLVRQCSERPVVGGFLIKGVKVRSFRRCDGPFDILKHATPRFEKRQLLD